MPFDFHTEQGRLQDVYKYHFGSPTKQPQNSSKKKKKIALQNLWACIPTKPPGILGLLPLTFFTTGSNFWFRRNKSKFAIFYQRGRSLGVI